MHFSQLNTNKNAAGGQQSHQAAQKVNQHSDSPTDSDDTSSDVRMYKALERRFERFALYLYPLSGDSLLVSSPHGFTQVVQNLHVARALVRRLEGVQ